MARELVARIGETAEETLARLGTTPSGLTHAEAAVRLVPERPRRRKWHVHHGPLRELGEVAAVTPARELARSLVQPLSAILLGAGVLSVFMGELVEAAIVIAMVVLSAAMDTVQAVRSGRAVERLKAQVAPTARVRREGASLLVPRRTLVVGDIVELRAGDLVPADVRLLEAKDLHVQEGALTGESMPSEKEASSGPLAAAGPGAKELAFLGTSVVSGTATAVVLATGSRTAFGDIVARVATRPQETEFDRGMRRFGVLILETVLFLVLFIVGVRIALRRDPLESLLFAVALAVGLTPEFLPMITTVTLAEGARRMAKAKVIVKRLAAIQNLGSIDVLCSDKTGTLTTGIMSLTASVDAFGEGSERPLFFGTLNSRFETGIRNPLEDAILARAVPTPGYEKRDERPFDFERRRLSVLVEKDGVGWVVTKGAPESVLAVCTHAEVSGALRSLDDASRRACAEAFRARSAGGERVIAVAYRSAPAARATLDEADLTLAGYLAFSDPLVEGVERCLAALRRDGVTVKILTGDNELVARHVCTEAGVPAARVVLGDEVERMTDGALAHVVSTCDVFARVTPAQKGRILAALKARGHVVGFFGDGINDAPALHAADVGISAAGAADVAKDASDILLLERRLDVLHTGIVAGRRSFANVLKYLLMGTSSNFGNMLSMAVAALVLPFLPMLPMQILVNNFLYDLAQIAIPTDKTDPSLLARPTHWDVGWIRRFMIAVGPISSIFDFVTFVVLLRVFRFDRAHFQTGWFVESLATQTLVLFVIRTAGRPWTNGPSAALTATALTVVGVAFALPYTPVGAVLGLVPLPASYFAFLAFAVPVYLGLVEITKRRLFARGGIGGVAPSRS